MPGQDYRIFVGAFPIGELAEHIQAVRVKYDPKTAAITPPHITLAGTYWRSGPPTLSNESTTIEHLKTLDGRIPAFPLLLGGIHSFSGGPNPVVFLGVEVTPALLESRRALLAVLGADKHREFHPHMTLAMRLDHARAHAMIAELEDTEWAHKKYHVPISELRLMQRGPKDPAWRVISTIRLREDRI